MWIREYTKIIAREQKEKIQSFVEDEKDSKKKILSKKYLHRMREIFNLYDEERKGFIGLENIRNIFAKSQSMKDIEDLFNFYDFDKDGALSFEEFTMFMLPKGYYIDEFDEEV